MPTLRARRDCPAVAYNPDTGLIAPQLQVIIDALTAMHRPNSGLTWIRQPHVEAVLRELARHPNLTHAVLDQLPAGHTTNYMRNLLGRARRPSVT
jgi:hypothetical protein